MPLAVNAYGDQPGWLGSTLLPSCSTAALPCYQGNIAGWRSELDELVAYLDAA